MIAWVTLCELDALSGRTSEETWQLGLEPSEHSIGLALSSSPKRDILGKGYHVMESFADHMSASVPAPCFTALDESDKVPHFSLANLFTFVLNTLDDEGALRGEGHVTSEIQ